MSGKLIGWYSAHMFDRIGACCYLTPQGDEVEITEVLAPGIRPTNSDAVLVGEVTTCAQLNRGGPQYRPAALPRQPLSLFDGQPLPVICAHMFEGPLSSSLRRMISAALPRDGYQQEDT